MYVSLGALTGLFVPLNLGFLGLRGLALKFHGKTTLKRSFFTVIYDQWFDLVIPILLLPPALLLIFKNIDVKTSACLSFAILILAALVFMKWQKYLIRLALNVYAFCQNIVGKELPQPISITALYSFTPQFTFKLFILSLGRYCNLILRAYCVICAANINISILDIVFSTPFVQLATLLSITPANLGIAEWSWVGMLSLFQVSVKDSATFSLLLRALVIFSLLLINGILLTSLLVPKLLFSPKSGGKQ